MDANVYMVRIPCLHVQTITLAWGSSRGIWKYVQMCQPCNLTTTTPRDAAIERERKFLLVSTHFHSRHSTLARRPQRPVTLGSTRRPIINFFSFLELFREAHTWSDSNASCNREGALVHPVVRVTRPSRYVWRQNETNFP